MSREAMQMALEALESDPTSLAWLISKKQAITALRQSLETEQEPVAEIQAEDMGKPFNAIRVTAHFYAEVPAVGTKLYKAPPKREWVGLTDEDIHDAFNFTEMVKQLSWDREPEQWCKNFAACIEAKIKDKNHG